MDALSSRKLAAGCAGTRPISGSFSCGLLAPHAPGRGCRIVSRRDLVRRAEVGLGETPQPVWAFLLDDLARGLPHRSRTTSSEREPDSSSMALEPVDEGLTRQDRSRRDCQIRFRSGPLLELNVPPVFQERLLNDASVGELIRQRARTVRFFGEQIFDHPRVTPTEEAVEIAKL